MAGASFAYLCEAKVERQQQKLAQDDRVQKLLIHCYLRQYKAHLCLVCTNPVLTDRFLDKSFVIITEIF